jgi:hypothetical protein
MKWSRRLVVIVLLFALEGSTARSASVDALSRWDVSLEIEYPPTGVVYGNGVFVGFGQDGRLVRSVDGKTWEASDRGAEGSVGIVFGNGQFVISGGDSIATSEDGLRWQNRYHSPTYGTWSPNFLNGRFFVLTDPFSGAGVVSQDGITWQPTGKDFRLPSTPAVLATYVAYGNGVYVATAATEILSSADGFVWTTRTNLDPRLSWIQGLTFANGTFVAIQNSTLWMSEDGIDWERGHDFILLAPQRIDFVAGRFIVAGRRYTTAGFETKVAVSPDGRTWSVPQTIGSSSKLVSITSGGTNIVISGDAIISSRDGLNWEELVPPRPSFVSVVERGDATFAFAKDRSGHQTMPTSYWASTNGSPWIRKTNALPQVNRVFATRDRLVALGKTVYTSDDGISWTEVKLPTSAPRLALRDFVSMTGISVAVGGSGVQIFNSTNLSVWNRAQVSIQIGFTPPTNLTCVVHGNGTFVAGGNAGGLFSSADGYNWTIRTSGTKKDITSIVFGDGKFTAIANSPYSGSRLGGFDLLQSGDGVTWAIVAAHAGSTNLPLFSFASGVYVGLADTYSPTQDIYVSEDLFSWARKPLISEEDFNGLFFAQNSFFLPTSDRLYVSKAAVREGPLRFTDWASLKGSALRVTLRSPPGVVAAIEGSSDLESWDFLGFVTNIHGRFFFTNFGAPSRRFYRAEALQRDPPVSQ